MSIRAFWARKRSASAAAGANNLHQLRDDVVRSRDPGVDLKRVVCLFERRHRALAVPGVALNNFLQGIFDRRHDALRGKFCSASLCPNQCVRGQVELRLRGGKHHRASVPPFGDHFATCPNASLKAKQGLSDGTMGRNLGRTLRYVGSANRAGDVQSIRKDMDAVVARLEAQVHSRGQLAELFRVLPVDRLVLSQKRDGPVDRPGIKKHIAKSLRQQPSGCRFSRPRRTINRDDEMAKDRAHRAGNVARFSELRASGYKIENMRRIGSVRPAKVGLPAGSWAAFMLLGQLVLSCKAPTPPTPERVLPNLEAPARDSKDPVVARVDGVPIFASDVTRQGAVEQVSPQAALDTLVTLEALTRFALKHKLGAGPEAEEGWKQILAQAWLARELEPQTTPDKIPQSVLQDVYSRTKDAYEHPRLVRIATLDLYAFSNQPAEVRKRSKAWAFELAEELRKIAPRPTINQVSALALTPKWVERGLKFGTIWQADTYPYSEKVGQAVQALHEWGELTPVVEDDPGFHIAMYLGERAATHKDFRTAAPLIRDAIAFHWQQKRFRDVTDELATKASVSVTPEALITQTLKQ